MLPTLDSPELVFGICSPIGTKNSRFTDILRTALLNFGYSLEISKVTDLMKSIVIPDSDIIEAPIEKRYDSYINYANKVREITGFNDALAILCCAAIKAHRRKVGASTYIPRQAYVFDQFKREEEVQALRQVYGRSFVMISLHSHKDLRQGYLTDRISSDHVTSRPDADHETIAKALIRRDQDEEGVAFGQRLREAFPLADLFLDMDDLEEAARGLNRFLALLFGSNKISSTRDEYAMYIAKSAALRSLDLSRQVGAAIFSKSGEVITLGCNEVPKAGGGTYWCDDPEDHRDYTLEKDENERIKKGILADITRRFAQSELITNDRPVEEIITFIMQEAQRKGSFIREAQLMDLMEFGRIIHAEMSAISDAARLGKSLKDAFLFCTTFPCHICAKHIVSAGIGRVVFIEPYPKSYADQLHSDSIIITSGDAATSKVKFQPFIGVSPLRFRELFERTRRKDKEGKFSDWIEGTPKLNVKYTIATYMQNETAITEVFKIKLDELIAKKIIMLNQ